MDPLRFTGLVRYWDPEKSKGLAVADIPPSLIPAFGGLKQQRVRGLVRGVPFESNVMPAGGGRLALSVSKAMMSAAGISIGDSADVEVMSIGRE